jgi:hypothetical protein
VLPPPTLGALSVGVVPAGHSSVLLALAAIVGSASSHRLAVVWVWLVARIPTLPV